MGLIDRLIRRLTVMYCLQVTSHFPEARYMLDDVF